MNQTSLVGRPLSALVGSLVRSAEKRGIWTGPLTSSSPELARLWGAPTSSTGMGVDETTAYTYSVFWACVNNIASDIASFPLNLYKTDPDGGKSVLRDHPLQGILHDSPNPEMTAYQFRGVLTSHAAVGTGYAEIVRDGAGRIAQLWPITPSRVQEKRETRAPYRLYYDVTRADGGIDRLTSDKMFVLPGSTVDGVYGRRIVDMARESIGLGLAAERFGGTFFGNGATFGGVIATKSPLTELARESFRKQMAAQHQGVDRAHKFLLMGDDATYTKLGIDPDHAQFLETRQHQIEEMCRWFRMPPHKVQHLIRTSYNSVEQMNIEYSTDTLTPWCVRWEQEVLRQLIAPSERRIQFVKHNMNSKLRGDTASRYEAHTKGIQNGFLSADDVREMEDLNPLPDGAGKKYFIQANTWPLDRVKEIIDKQVGPDPKPAAPPPADPTVDKAARAFQEQIDSLTTQMVQHVTRAVEAETKETATAEERDAAKTAAQSHEDAARALRTEIDALVLARDTALAEAARSAAERDALAAEREAALIAKAAADVDRDAAEAARVAEAARLQADLATAEARALQAEQDREVMAQTALVANLTLTDLREQLALADQVNVDTAQTVVAQHTALEEARTQLEALQATLQATQDEIAALAELRAASETDAATAVLAAADAHRAVAEATERLAHATAEADMARARLEAETAERMAERETEQAAHEATRVRFQARMDAEVARLQDESEAQRDLILRSVGRFVSKESERVRKNSTSPARLLAWADGYYLLAEETLVDELRPVMRGHLARIRSTQDVDAYTRALVHPHLQTAAAHLRAVAKGDPEDFSVSLERLLTRWEHDRPTSIAAAVAKEEVGYVRSL